MSNKRKKNIVVTATKYGNWYRLREWSRAARICHEFTKSKQWHDGRKVREMIHKSVLCILVEDVCLAPMPTPIANMMRSDRQQLELLTKRMIRLLDTYGKRSLVYVDTESTSQAERIKLATSGQVYLDVAQTSMPLNDFVYYFKDGTSLEVLQEWSGIPQDEITNTYEEIVTFFWRELRKMQPSEEENGFTFGSEAGIHFHGHCDVQFIYNGPHAGGGGKLPSP